MSAYHGGYATGGAEVQIRMKVDIYTDGPNEGLNFYQTINAGHPEGQIPAQAWDLNYPHGAPSNALPHPAGNPLDQSRMIQWPDSTTNSEAGRDSETREERRERHRRRKERSAKDSSSSITSKKSSNKSEGESSQVDELTREKRRKPRRNLRRRETEDSPVSPSMPRTTDPSSEDNTMQNNSSSKDESFFLESIHSASKKPPPIPRPRTLPTVPPHREDILDVTPQDVVINTFESDEAQSALAIVQSQIQDSRFPMQIHTNNYGNNSQINNRDSGGYQVEFPRDSDSSTRGGGGKVLRQIDERITTTTMKLEEIRVQGLRQQTYVYPTSSASEDYQPSRSQYEENPPSYNSAQGYRHRSSSPAYEPPVLPTRYTPTRPQAPPRQLRVSFNHAPPETRDMSPPPMVNSGSRETLIDDIVEYSSSPPRFGGRPQNEVRTQSNEQERSEPSVTISLPMPQPQPQSVILQPNPNSIETLIDDVAPPHPPPEKKETLIDDVGVVEEPEISHQRINDMLNPNLQLTTYTQTQRTGVNYDREDTSEKDSTTSTSTSSYQHKGISLVGGQPINTTSTTHLRRRHVCDHQYTCELCQEDEGAEGGWKEEDGSTVTSNDTLEDNDQQLPEVVVNRSLEEEPSQESLPSSLGQFSRKSGGSRDQSPHNTSSNRQMSSAAIFEMYTKNGRSAGSGKSTSPGPLSNRNGTTTAKSPSPQPSHHSVVSGISGRSGTSMNMEKPPPMPKPETRRQVPLARGEEDSFEDEPETTYSNNPNSMIGRTTIYTIHETETTEKTEYQKFIEETVRVDKIKLPTPVKRSVSPDTRALLEKHSLLRPGMTAPPLPGFPPRSRNSIDSERSSVTGVVKSGGSYNTRDIISTFGEDNLSDYLQGRLSPLGREMGSYAESTLSKDSVISEASLTADRSHAIYNSTPSPRDTMNRSVTPTENKPEPPRSLTEEPPRVQERSFAEIMKSKNQPPPTQQRSNRNAEMLRNGGSSTSISSFGSLRQDSVKHAPVLNRPPMGDSPGGLYGEAKIGMALLGADKLPMVDRKAEKKKPTAL